MTFRITEGKSKSVAFTANTALEVSFTTSGRRLMIFSTSTNQIRGRIRIDGTDPNATFTTEDASKFFTVEDGKPFTFDSFVAFSSVRILIDASVTLDLDLVDTRAETREYRT